MKKIEAATLADAYEKAALELECSITELQYEVIQHPSSGVLGFFKKSAIIVAECKRTHPEKEAFDYVKEEENNFDDLSDEKEDSPDESDREIDTGISEDNAEDESYKSAASPQASKESAAKEILPAREKNRLDVELTQRDDAVLESFFDTKEMSVQQRPENNNLELAEKIEAELAELMSHSCFAIDTVEVDVVDNTALIFIDGDDAALLIGKEGYRYNALSYMLFNWLHTKYDLYVKLEIAQFLTTQQEMIHHYIQPVIEFVNINGKGKTRPLDGILVQIALEQLREVFPNKYVAVKTGRDGRKYVIINAFNSKRNG